MPGNGEMVNLSVNRDLTAQVMVMMSEKLSDD